MDGRTLSEKVCYVIFHDMVIEAHQTTLISLLVILSMKPFFPRSAEHKKHNSRPVPALTDFQNEKAYDCEGEDKDEAC